MPLADAVRHLREGVWRRERLRRANPGARIASTVRVAGDLRRVTLAPGSSVHGPTVLWVTDGGGRTDASLRVGERTYIGEFCNIRCGGAPVVIGADCLISQSVSIIGTNHAIRAGQLVGAQPWVGDGVHIGSGVWIGAGAVILPGSRLEDGVVVGAHSVVRGTFRAGAVVIGTPAGEIRRRC